MNSRIIGTLSFDDDLLKQDIETILQFGDVREEYSEYRFGLWKNYVLWNGTGDQKDTLYMGPDGGAFQTGLGNQLPYVNSVIDKFFHTDKLKMVRANLLRDALLIPHRDYIEFKSESEHLARVHLPLKTNSDALHSEGDSVFHLRCGEVWYLDASNVHSACNPSDEPRISLVLDFRLDGDSPLESVLKQPLNERPKTAPAIIERESLSDDFRNSIHALKHVINRANYRDILLFLSRVHFYKNVSGATLFDWMIEICEGSEDRELLEKFTNFKSYMIQDRQLGERFHL
jgi:hypothetical protein